MPFYKQSYKRIRFHVEFGPPSLFERVRFKMKDVTTLYMDGVHFQTRASERNIPDDIMARLLQFDINEWRVVTASVREDRGKFIDSTWEIVIDGVRYWVTIGMGTFIKTIVIKETSGVEKTASAAANTVVWSFSCRIISYMKAIGQAMEIRERIRSVHRCRNSCLIVLRRLPRNCKR